MTIANAQHWVHTLCKARLVRRDHSTVKKVFTLREPPSPSLVISQSLCVCIYMWLGQKGAPCYTCCGLESMFKTLRVLYIHRALRAAKYDTQRALHILLQYIMV